MGIKGTFNIDRATAINVIITKVNSLNNDELGDMLEAFPESYFRNYWVCDQLTENCEEYNTIKNINEF